MCSAFGAVGNRMSGSDITEVITQSGICASGSINNVLSGKQYNRALRVHKLVLELIKILSETPSSENLEMV